MILKTEEALGQEAPAAAEFLEKLGRLEFWKIFFASRDFTPRLEKFSWDYWREIPFFTKPDFLKAGFEPRWQDAVAGDGFDAYRFIFRITSGTTGATEPLLILRPQSAPRSVPDDEPRTIWLYEPFSLGLRGVLFNILCNRRENTNKNQAFVIDPYTLNQKMREAIRDFNADSVAAFPTGLAKFTSVFEAGENFFKTIKKAILGGDFLSKGHLEAVKDRFQSLAIDLSYGLAEFGVVGEPCRFLNKKYGFNAYHPRQRRRVIEVVDADEEGYGEIVGTLMAPVELALLRYRTGDIGKALREKCECGADFTIFLVGRKDFDYVKCAGAMVVRQELERVLGGFEDIVGEWRAEAREFVRGRRLLGELTLKVKVKDVSLGKTEVVSSLAGAVSRELFLTPTETLAELAAKGKFLPLRLELVEEFGKENKQVLLRKIT